MRLTPVRTPAVYLYILFILLSFRIPAFGQAPTITSFTPTTVCQGEQVIITGKSFNGTTAVQLGSLAAKSFMVKNDSTITAIVADKATSGKIKVSTPKGDITSSADLTINEAPIPELLDKSPGRFSDFANCSGSITYTLTVENNAVPAGGSCTYDIDWGDNTSHFIQTDWQVGSQTPHTYQAQGYFKIILTITPKNGCKKTKSYDFYSGGNPVGGFGSDQSTVNLCAPATISFKITGQWYNNTPGTYYYINWGDNSDTTLQHPLNSTNSDQVVKHTYTKTPCPDATFFTAAFKAANGCVPSNGSWSPIGIGIKPTASFKVDQTTICVNDPICFDNNSLNGYSGSTLDCNSPSSYQWDFGDGGTSSATDPACYTYKKPGTYKLKLSATSSCGTDDTSETITVKDISLIPIVTTPITYCQFATAVPLKATGINLLWYTTPTGGVGSSTAPTPNTSVPNTTIYYVSQTIAGQCESPRVALTVTVHPMPGEPGVITPVDLCKGATASPLTATGTGLLWYTTSTGGTGSPAAPTPSTANVITTNYYVSQTTNGCEGPRAVITVNVNDKPVAPTVVTPVGYCKNQAAQPLEATGSQLLWYTVATGGTGSPVTPIPSTTATGTTIYYVSQSNSCGESPRASITVNVFPGPSATITYSPSSLCNSSTAAAVPVAITGDKTGSFSISPSGLPIDPSSGTITPANAKAGTYTITYTINASGGCSVFTTTTTVSVSSTPSATIQYPPICSSDGNVAVVINGTTGGIFSSGSGLVINQATGAITASASTPGTYTVKYTINPSPPCPGSGASTTVTITKAPSAAIKYEPSNFCNTATAPAVDVILTGDKGGSFSIQPAGLTIDPATGKLSPAGAATGNYTITYTINASGGCSQFTTATTVSVSNTPMADIQYPPICSSDGNVAAIINGTKGGTFSAGAGLVIDQTAGIITPSASIPGNYTVKYVIAPSPPCPGFETSANVMITKAPSASIQYVPSNFCNTSTASSIDVNLTGDKGGNFSVQPSAGLKVDAVTGKVSPAGATPGSYTITYTIDASGGCAIFTTSTTVSVSSTPFAVIQYRPICSSEGAVPVILTGTNGGAFSAEAGLAIDPTSGTITASASIPGTYTVKYTITPSPPCPGFDTSVNVTITKAPSASISYPGDLCNFNDVSNPPVAVILSGDEGGIFSIEPSTGLPLNTTSGEVIPAGAAAGTYTITYTIKGTGGCKDFSTSATVVVQSTPTAKIQYTGSPYCGNSSSATVILTGNAGGMFSSLSGLSIDANTGTINPSLSKPGIYTVTYIIAPSPPCPGFTTDTKVEIAESPVISFPVSSQAICSGETAVFKPTSTVPNTVYAWSVEGELPPGITGATSGTVSGPDATISLLFTNTGTTSATISIKVTPVNPAQNPCGGNPVTLLLTINPIPAVLKADTNLFCMHAPPMALTATPAAGNTIQWYDENNTALSQAPVINTTNPAQFIFYAAQVTPSGCESPKATFIAIVHPVAKIISSSYTNPTSCGIPSGSISLHVVDLNGNAMPNLPVQVHYIKFQTAYNVADSTDGSGKIIISLTAGTYSDIYVETYGCLSQKIPDIFVLKDPDPPAQPVAGYNAPVCSETILNLSASSPTSSQPGPISYVWVGPAFGNLPDTTQNTVVSFPSAKTSYNGTYIVYAMQNNCISAATSFPVEIKQSPVKPLISAKTPLCVGDNLTLQAYSSIPGNSTLSYVWNGPGSGFPVNAANAGITAVKVEDGGVYSVTVTTAETGCSVTSDTLIQVGDYPVVKFAQDSFNVPTGHILQLSPSIVNASDPHVLPIQQFAWTPSANIQCNDAACSAPAVTVKNNICYTVKATNIYGCSGSDTVCIATFCKSAQVFIPNAFTPRGLAVNSRFMVRASGIASIKSFRVFNRWGKIVFERNNFPANDAAFGWDGFINGKIADMGVYVYTVEVVCENGTPYSYKGNVTLLQ